MRSSSSRRWSIRWFRAVEQRGQPRPDRFAWPVEVDGCELLDLLDRESKRAEVADHVHAPDRRVVEEAVVRLAAAGAVLNFFVSPATAERWLSEHPQVRGTVISMQEAAAAGRAVFGDVLMQS
jgi:Alkylmercury lyase